MTLPIIGVDSLVSFKDGSASYRDSSASYKVSVCYKDSARYMADFASYAVESFE